MSLMVSNHESVEPDHCPWCGVSWTDDWACDCFDHYVACNLGNGIFECSCGGEEGVPIPPKPPQRPCQTTFLEQWEEEFETVGQKTLYSIRPRSKSDEEQT